MKGLLLIIILAIGINIDCYNQCDSCRKYLKNSFYVKVSNNLSEYDINKEKNINTLFSNFNVTYFSKAFPYSGNKYLISLYEVTFDGNKNEFKNIILSEFPDYFEKIIDIPDYENQMVYDPSDYMWYLTTDTTSWLWHLKKTKANIAWDITKGDTNVKIGILDTWFDVNHPDLKNQINPHHDPYDLSAYSSNCCENNHGTTVASFVAAETDGGGQLASIGFNCKLVCYQAWDGNYLQRAQHAALNQKVDVLTSSAGGWSCVLDSIMDAADTVEMLAVKEILDSGTIIVMPAGNGINGTHCRPGLDAVDTPWRPLSPVYDERVIIVTSIGSDSKHYYNPTGSLDKTHSHYPEVDICSPGYCIMGAQCTKIDTATLGCSCDTNTWPYYGCSNGTSHATPQVAGACALMKSINPCISPAEAQSILKRTAMHVVDSSSYPNGTGAGIMNAYAAVLEAGTYYIQNDTISNDKTVTSGLFIKCGYDVTDYKDYGPVLLNNNAEIELLARKKVYIKSRFKVEQGVKLKIDVQDNLNIVCN